EGLDDGEHDVTVLNLSAGITHRTKTPVSSDRRFDIELPLARVSGTVIDAESGRPLEGATVQLEAPSGATANAGRVFVVGRSGDTTDATGRFTIEGVSDGNYTLIARKDGYAHETRPVAIAPSLEPAELDITLNRSDALRLLVTDAASGLPVRSLSALVISGGAGDPLSPGGTGALAAYRGVLSTDASGAMSLDSLQPGVYRIVLGGAGLGWQTVQDVRVPGPELALAMSRGGRLEVELTGAPAGRTARGCLLDALGKPVHVNGFSPEPAVSIRAGTPEVLQEIAPGIYRLRVQIPGGGIAEKEVEIAPGSTTRVRIP
ncbi:MAG TPA: carboxypeptidase regulatory-like domain-containing protein, partial [Candidatus Polarisedimenticolia bacterium]|nr:carboxypeptidase regulatory-like domain-containing protein [Candidatus Polarisedimenticolia bacterium]